METGHVTIEGLYYFGTPDKLQVMALEDEKWFNVAFFSIDESGVMSYQVKKDNPKQAEILVNCLKINNGEIPLITNNQ